MRERDKMLSTLKEVDPNLFETYKKLILHFVSQNSEFPSFAEISPKKELPSELDSNAKKDKEIDIAIIVAVPNEKDGVYSAFGLPRALPRKHDLLDQYRLDYVQFEHSGLNIALLIQPNMGMTQSASLTTRTILALHPKLVAMVGICAGRKEKANLGDIVVASTVFDYTAGKHYVDRFGPRPMSYPIDDSIATYIVGSVIDNHELIGKILDNYHGEKPKQPFSIQFKPIASGTAVIDDKHIIDEIAKTQDDLVGIDMEAYALAVSSNILRTKWIVIKTVQDFADGEKSTTEGSIRTFAAYSSAKLLELMLPSLSEYL